MVFPVENMHKEYLSFSFAAVLARALHLVDTITVVPFARFMVIDTLRYTGFGFDIGFTYRKIKS
jgi:hypothetical protein